MLHTSISAYANRNRILARLVASFPLLFTTSSNVFCSKFGGVCETLWIFKFVRWTHDRCTKINKSPTEQWFWSFILWDLNCKSGSVTYCGHPNKLMEFRLWRFNLEIYKVSYPIGTQNPDIDVDISDLVMMMSWCLMSSDVIWHIRDKLWPMPKHGSIKSTYVRCMHV